MNFSELKNEAKAKLNGNWSTVIIASLIYYGIYSVIQIPSLISSIVELFNSSTTLFFFENEALFEMPEFVMVLYDFFSAPAFSLPADALTTFALPVLAFGLYSIAYKVINGIKTEVTDIFDGFRNFGNIFILHLLSGLYILLWSLLFIIPGIVKSISYSMSDFIMAENPDMKPSDAIRESEKLMDGYKLDYFLLSLSFIGWHILDLFTLGILSIWLTPYIHTTNAAFYEKIKREKFGDAAVYIYKGTPNPQYENGYNPYQQNGTPYTPDSNGYEPYNNSYNGYPVQPPIPDNNGAMYPPSDSTEFNP